VWQYFGEITDTAGSIKTAMKDLKQITKRFFTAYDAHDVDSMLALCANDAQGRYCPYGMNSVMPIRGGLEQIWRGFPKAVPDFKAELLEMILAEGNIVVVQAAVGGTVPGDAPGIIKKGEVARIPHCYIIRYNADGKISRLDCYWDNSSINSIKMSAL
jgi:ketosteroid isomerase-like protein